MSLPSSTNTIKVSFSVAKELNGPTDIVELELPADTERKLIDSGVYDGFRAIALAMFYAEEGVDSYCKSRVQLRSGMGLEVWDSLVTAVEGRELLDSWEMPFRIESRDRFARVRCSIEDGLGFRTVTVSRRKQWDATFLVCRTSKNRYRVVLP